MDPGRYICRESFSTAVGYSYDGIAVTVLKYCCHSLTDIPGTTVTQRCECCIIMHCMYVLNCKFVFPSSCRCLCDLMPVPRCRPDLNFPPNSKKIPKNISSSYTYHTIKYYTSSILWGKCQKQVYLFTLSQKKVHIETK